jgi:hypothetical protein
MIGIGLSPLFKRGGGSVSYGAYTTAFNTQVLAAGGSLTPSELSALTLFETSMGADMAEFDRLWIHGLSNRIAARTSFVNPTSTPLTEVNSPTWTASQGFNGSVGSYKNTNFNPSTSGVKYTRNSAGIFTYSLTNSAVDICEIGNQSGLNFSYILSKSSSNAAVFSLNSNNDTNNAVADSLSLFQVLRTDSSNYALYKRGVLVKTISQPSQALLNQSYFLNARNNNGTADLFSARKISASGFSSGAVNPSTFYTALQALGTTLGWAV